MALLKHGYAEQIVTFGKLPKKAIQIPKFTGGTTTPDFVYKVGRNLYLLVDTKPADIRDGEKRTVKIKEQFLTQLSDKVHYKVAETVQEVTKELDKL